MENKFTDYQHYIALSRYARWRDDLGRRETWEETVSRYCDFFYHKLEQRQDIPWEEIKQAIISLDIMPSMRCLMTAGKALDRDNVAGYNCSYVAIDNQKCFDELMYILMCGTGVGFSVERRYVEKLPTIAETFYNTDTLIIVNDSKIGWATAYRELLSLLYSGKIPKWDVSKVRPQGTKLKTFGGRASGPEPLNALFNFTIETFKRAMGRKLTSIECHDIVCKIAEIVVVGGVRRSALLSLSDLEDERMAKAKSGAWWEEFPQRALSNNSVCYSETPEIDVFMKEWLNLYESKAGERGIFNRKAAKVKVASLERRDVDYDFGTNPCSEIILRNKQFCNLSEVVIREIDTIDTLKTKIKLATIIGTIQSTLTDFRYLSKEWIRNTEEERLLGVSLTGIMDNKVMSDRSYLNLPHILNELKNEAIKTNKKYSKLLGVAPSAAITCIKPSGTVSQLVDSSSGIHSRFSPFYIRTVRADKKDPVTTMLVQAGFPCEDDVTSPNTTCVFSFPIKAPKAATYKNDISAIEQLELWKIYQQYWCEHKPSITVFYKQNEFLDLGAWVYNNFNCISGISFLPHTDHIYKQAPYQEIDEKQYNEWLEKMPKNMDWNMLDKYEIEDTTNSSKELACSAGNCELI